MRFGVNYTPRQGWFYSWLDFDRAQVQADFTALKEIGADHVRIFPLWTLLQPNRTYIRPQAIRDVVSVAEVADDLGLDIFVDVLQGHLSSYDFLPSWVLSWHERNIFTDPQVVAAQQNLITTLAGALADIPHARGLSLGNEIIQFAASRHPSPQALTSHQARTWLETLYRTAKAAWPHGIHTHSFDDDLWFAPDQPFTPELATAIGDLTTVHSWIFGGVGPAYGADAPELAWFARYLCEVANAWAEISASAPEGRGLWLQELGAPLNYLHDDAAAATFLTKTIDCLLGAHGGGPTPHLQAITWWCSHDVDRHLADFPEVEYGLGLFNSAGELKPQGQAFQKAITQWGTRAGTASRTGATSPHPSASSGATSLHAGTTSSPASDTSSAQNAAAPSSAAGTPRNTLRINICPQRRDLLDPRHEFFATWVAHARAGDVRRIVLGTAPTPSPATPPVAKASFHPQQAETTA
ncbi:Endo-beta-mannanase [Actinobaculum suis]|uniref:Endo-beta-mannanase n=1 Tax=Actinobaculum suis TaxID=1657 RepID=A0A1B9BF60_9ACTO|nr:hypothetical protein [Actinobaculum suis]OCA96301.1 hypothetical protein ACU20_00160 [Actinobaculum suis]OCA96340.1 hypothetical protein ACU21_00160 [Actinobaculum suis]VDG76793.1 Endo-beta-mannanase [Actinobaculum suis]